MKESMDELLLVSALDQSIDTDDESVMKRVDEIWKEAIKQKNAYIALNACKSLIQITKISGIGLAKILYLIYSNWDEFDIKDDFEDIVYEYIGLHKQTVDKYVKVWEMHQDNKIPEKFEKAIMQRNIKDQIPIAIALKQGYEIKEKEWGKLANASDFSEISKIVREEVKGKEPTKGSLYLYLDKMGTIWAVRGGQREFVGSLEIHSDIEFVKQAIQRIIKNTGMMEK
jgi:hypothetical protein